MPKTKEQKRKEALQRQREYLLNVAIPHFNTVQPPVYDKGDKKIIRDRLISSAYAAHCDKNGNYLDERFYKDMSVSLQNPDLLGYALRYTLYSLEEMKEIIEDGGKSLYEIAYWM